AATAGQALNGLSRPAVLLDGDQGVSLAGSAKVLASGREWEVTWLSRKAHVRDVLVPAAKRTPLLGHVFACDGFNRRNRTVPVVFSLPAGLCGLPSRRLDERCGIYVTWPKLHNRTIGTNRAHCFIAGIVQEGVKQFVCTARSLTGRNGCLGLLH